MTSGQRPARARLAGGLALLGVALATVSFAESAGTQVSRGHGVSRLRVASRTSGHGHAVENQRLREELQQVVHNVTTSPTRGSKHRSGRKFLRAIERVVLRHSCVKMDSDEIIHILKQGREGEPMIKKQLQQLRKTLSRRAMLCRLKRVRWMPIRVEVGNKRRKPKAQGVDAFLQSILSQGGEGDAVAAVQSFLSNNSSAQPQVNPLATLACHKDVPYKQLVPGRRLLLRLRGQLQESGCWTRESESLYHTVERLAESPSGRHARITARAWCALMRRFNRCKKQQKQHIDQT